MASPVGATPYAARRRRPRWLAWVFVALLVVPTVEIAAIIGVGKVIGAWPTVALLVLESLFGAWLVRREGARTWRALAEALQTGMMPSRQLADAALMLVGGTLLLTPGFLTDLVGFALIMPFTAQYGRRLLAAAIARRLGAVVVGASFGPGGASGPTVVPGEVRRED